MKAECGRRTRPPTCRPAAETHHDASCFVATTRKTVEAMKLVAATICTAASAKPFVSTSAASNPRRPRMIVARPIAFAHTVRLARIDLVSVMTGPFWVEGGTKRASSLKLLLAERLKSHDRAGFFPETGLGSTWEAEVTICG